MLTIREYRQSDWPALCTIHDRARLDELRLSVGVGAFRSLEETAQAEGLFDGELWVACEEGRVVAFVAFTQEEITWLYVDPDCYRRGAGRRLLEFALTRCGEVVRTQCLQGNTPASELYSKVGFRVEKTTTGHLVGDENVPATGLTFIVDSNRHNRQRQGCDS